MVCLTTFGDTKRAISHILIIFHTFMDMSWLGCAPQRVSPLATHLFQSHVTSDCKLIPLCKGRISLRHDQIAIPPASDGRVRWFRKVLIQFGAKREIRPQSVAMAPPPKHKCQVCDIYWTVWEIRMAEMARATHKPRWRYDFSCSDCHVIEDSCSEKQNRILI